MASVTGLGARPVGWNQREGQRARKRGHECGAQRPFRLATKVVEEAAKKILEEVAEGPGGGAGGDTEA